MVQNETFRRGAMAALFAAPLFALLVVLAGGRSDVLLSGSEAQLAIVLLVTTVTAVALISATLALLGWSETSDQRVLLLAASFVAFAAVYMVHAQRALDEPAAEVLNPVARTIFAAGVLGAILIRPGRRSPVPPRRVASVTLALVGGTVLMLGITESYRTAPSELFGEAPGGYLAAWGWAALVLSVAATVTTWRAASRSQAPVLHHLAVGMTLLTEASVLFVMGDPETTVWWLGDGAVTAAAIAMGAGLAMMYARGHAPSSIYDLEVLPTVVDAATSSGDAVLLVDSEGNVLSTSENAALLFPGMKVAGRRLADLPGGEAWGRAWRASGCEEITVAQGTERRTIMVTPARLPSPPGGAVLVARDVTGERHQQERVGQLTRDLESSREALQRRAESLEEAYRDVVRGLGAFGAALARRDNYDAAHHQRLADLAARVAERVGPSGAAVRHVRNAGMLHDIGKVVVPEEVLASDTAVGEAAWDYLREVPIVSERILREVSFLRGACKIVRHAHERYDGKGYPDGLAGDHIPIGARVVAVCAAFLAMTSDRPYREAMPAAEALEEIRAGIGSQFCPAAATALIEEVSGRPTGEPLARTGGDRR